MSYTPRKRRKSTFITDIPLTPLIDTALTLLIIFMVTSPMINNVIKVTLPRGNVQEGSGTDQNVVIYIDQSNAIFFNGKQVDENALLLLLKEALGKEQNGVVCVKADSNAHYGNVIELIDNIKAVGGVKHVALATQKRL